MDLIVMLRFGFHLIFSSLYGIVLVYAVILEIPLTTRLQFRPKPVSSGLIPQLESED